MADSIHTLTLSTYVYGGEVLGRLPDGRAVFVPFAIPGETVLVRLVEEKRRYARAELLDVLEPNPQRITARCAHFGDCGGCHYQHLPYRIQLETKTAILLDQLERIGGLKDPPVESILASPQDFNYRNHIQLHLTEEGRLGYHKAGSQDVFAIQECHLPLDEINHTWPQLDFEHIPEIERIGIRCGEQGELQLILESGDVIAPELLVEDIPVSVVHLSPVGSLVLAGSESLIFEIHNRHFRVSAGSFFQINSGVATRMIELLMAELDDLYSPGGIKTAIDAYCGVGLFSAIIAPRVDRLIGIEASASACEDFGVNLDEFDHVELYEAKVEQVLPSLQDAPDLLVLDPPRTGVDHLALDAILDLRVPNLVYISCDPATLARDAKRLIAGGYQLVRITPLDMFPQTYHIETLSVWQR